MLWVNSRLCCARKTFVVTLRQTHAVGARAVEIRLFSAALPPVPAALVLPTMASG